MGLAQAIPRRKTADGRFGLTKGYHRMLWSAALATSLATGPLQAQPTATHLPLSKVVPTPGAAKDLCSRYDWACSAAARDESHLSDLGAIAKKINRKVNQRIRPVDDFAQYRMKDYWTLPAKNRGDCEDFALLKKYELIRLGVSPDRLLIATVVGKRTGAHAVLVLRLDGGDYVLDSLTNSIKPWYRTDYTFLRVQNPDAPKTWMSVAQPG